MVKTYFIAPNESIHPPPLGPLKLGHIVARPNEPEIRPRNRHGWIEPPPADVQAPHFQNGFTAEREDLLKGSFGIWAKVLALFGMSTSIGIERSSADVLKVDKLETLSIDPTDEYVRKSINTNDVLAFVEGRGKSKPLYMITGLKIARGASWSYAKTSVSQQALKASAPVQGVEVGGSVQIEHQRSDRTAVDSSSDFVLAYRIRRIRMKDGQLRDQELYTRGTLMQDTSHGEDRRLELEAIDDDVDVEELKLQTKIRLFDVEEDCQIFSLTESKPL